MRRVRQVSARHSGFDLAGRPTTVPARFDGLGLVRDRAEGTRRIYQANVDGLREMRALLDRFWNQTLANFKQLVEHPEEDA